MVLLHRLNSLTLGFLEGVEVKPSSWIHGMAVQSLSLQHPKSGSSSGKVKMSKEVQCPGSNICNFLGRGCALKLPRLALERFSCAQKIVFLRRRGHRVPSALGPAAAQESEGLPCIQRRHLCQTVLFTLSFRS